MINSLALVAAIWMTSIVDSPDDIHHRKRSGVFLDFGIGLSSLTPPWGPRFQASVLIGRYFAVRPGWYVAPTVGYEYVRVRLTYNHSGKCTEREIPWGFNRIVAGLRIGYRRRMLDLFVLTRVGGVIAQPYNSECYSMTSSVEGFDAGIGPGIILRFARRVGIGAVALVGVDTLRFSSGFRIGYPAFYTSLTPVISFSF